MNAYANKLLSYCDILLEKEATWTTKKQQLENIHELFAQLGASDAYGNTGRDSSADTPQAIAPAWAAMCMFDIARTVAFVAGIRQAIAHKIKHSQHPVQVLDAGCGPYALLCLLPALYFSPGQVLFYAIDIYPQNISSARKLVAALGMQHYFKQVDCEDALQYPWTQPLPPDVAITETMNRALYKEPQVAISLQLARLLSPQGILVPALVKVNLVCINKNIKAAAMQTDPAGEPPDPSKYQSQLGNIISLHKQSTPDSVFADPLVTLEIPAYYDPATFQLELHTEVTVYGDHIIRNNEAAITLPLPIYLHHDKPLALKKLSFFYNTKGTAGLSIVVMDDNV